LVTFISPHRNKAKGNKCKTGRTKQESNQLISASLHGVEKGVVVVREGIA
jgi:hypothetical protein